MSKRRSTPPLVCAAMLGAVLLNAVSCETSSPNPVCTQEAVASLFLEVLGADDKAFPSATIDVATQTTAPFTLSCNGNCDAIIVGYEIPGLIRYSVSAPGYVTVTGSANVPLDAQGCHVVPQSRSAVLRLDNTIGALSGAWSYTNFVGQTVVLRFGTDGKIIGAVLVKYVNTGDQNLYVAYNGNKITGVPGQPIHNVTGVDPTRNGNTFDWSVTTLGYPVGFNSATMSTDFRALTGTLLNAPISFTRLDSIPAALR